MTDSSSPKVEAAKDQASQLKDQAVSSGQHVAETAADQAGSVVGEAKVQARDLLGQAQSELRDQAGSQQKRVATGLRAVSDELKGMAESQSDGGIATDLVHQAASRASGIATWLEDRDPGTLLSDVRSYAARKPGTFIAIAAIAGVVAGRLTRSLAGNATDEKAKEQAATPARVSDVTTTPGYVDPGYVDPGYVDPGYVDPAPVDPAPTSPAPVDPLYADAAPIDDISLRSHNVDDEFGDRATVESLFGEDAPTRSFDETAQGDDYRGDRS
ncbi:hypothetical protein [Subtercola boreus]|uniref:hypothetical protein n=1 Tax=Subtercola boreus TaxID=120213 RepID=UPI001C0EFE8B|nr:hypothetical protein [Subtercola boreus]